MLALRWLHPYLDRRIIIVTLMGFSSGVPLLLIGGTLGAWLLESGVEKSTIGLFALVAIPYSFNFLWAPFIDQLRLPLFTRLLGRRRGWLLCVQLLLVAAIALLSFYDPAAQSGTIALIALLIAFLSASQDVVVDAYRADILEDTQYGAGAAMAVLGYRIGMLTTGAGALALADQLDWSLVYLCMSAAMGVGILATLFAREPERTTDAKTQSQPFLRRAIVAPFADFTTRYRHWILILLFIFCYRFSDGFIGFMTTPFFLDIGFTKTTVAGVAKLYGFGATLFGMFLGGILIGRWPIMRCLFVFGVLQIFTNIAYILLSFAGPELEMLMFTVAMDNMSGGMITAAAIAYMMTLCNPAFTATQYALFASLASFASKTIAGGAGFVAEAYGWAAMFGLSGLMGVPALVLLYYLFPLRSPDLRDEPNAPPRD